MNTYSKVTPVATDWFEYSAQDIANDQISIQCLDVIIHATGKDKVKIFLTQIGFFKILGLFNMRGDDIPYNPFFYSYTLLTMDEIW